VPPTGGETGNRNLRLATTVRNLADGTGLALDSYVSIYPFLIKARRSPDAAWIPVERWDALTPEEEKPSPDLPRLCGGVTLSQ